MMVFILLIAAWFTGEAAMKRFDHTQTDPAWALTAITIALVLGAVVVAVVNRLKGQDDW